MNNVIEKRNESCHLEGRICPSAFHNFQISPPGYSTMQQLSGSSPVGLKSHRRRIELPRVVLVGSGALEDINDVCLRLFPKGRALIICDEITLKVGAESIFERLDDAGYSPEYHIIKDANKEEVDSVLASCSSGNGNTGRENAKDDVSFITGVGGGRPVDVAKCSAFRAGKYFISVPTAASHDGIASAAASITVEGKKTSISTAPPLAVVADTSIISDSPYRLLASGSADIISNHTAVEDWRRARDRTGEYYSVYAAELSLMTARMLEERAAEIPDRADRSVRMVVNALVSSGVAMSIAGSSRPASGAEHLFSHALDRIAKLPALHGEQCGLGSIITAHLQGGDWEGIRDSLSTIKAPITASAAGLSREEIIQALVMAPTIRPERYTVLEGGIDIAQAEEVAEATGVI